MEREEFNQRDDYAVAVTKNGDIVVHVWESISRVSWFLLKRGGALHVNDPALIRDPAFISEPRMFTPGF